MIEGADATASLCANKEEEKLQLGIATGIAPVTGSAQEAGWKYYEMHLSCHNRGGGGAVLITLACSMAGGGGM